MAENIIPDSAFYEVIARVADGASLKGELDKPDAPFGRRTFYDRIAKDDAMRRAWDSARMDRADAIVDECEGIVAKVLNKELEPKAAQVAINMKLWLAERADPRRYGAKQTLEHTGNGSDFMSVLQRAQGKIQEQAKEAAKASDGSNVVKLESKGKVA